MRPKQRKLDQRTMDRIRLGLTGLAAILAIVFVASSAMRSDQGDSSNSAAGETLSVIGVAPKMDDNARPPDVEPEPAKAQAAPERPR